MIRTRSLSFAVLLAFAFSGAIYAAQPQHESLSERKSADGRLTFKRFEQGHSVASQEMDSWLLQSLLLPQGTAFSHIRQSKDKLGMTHERLQQTFQGIPIFGAVMMLHGDGSQVQSFNGQSVAEIAAGRQVLSEQQALQKALDYVAAESYLWEQPGANLALQSVTGKLSNTWYPLGELFYIKAEFGGHIGEFRLAWRLNIHADKPLSHANIFVDAENGEIVARHERLCHADAIGTAHTYYSGIQSIVTDSTGSLYRLRESSRAMGVETYSLLNTTNFGMAVDMEDTDNIWDTFAMPQYRSALDAHWGAEMTFDYFMNFHGRNSYDDQGAKLISYVNYDNSYSNAFWNGLFMTYGDGGSNNRPFAGLDVCGHEFSHGVTEYSANLVYAYEPGALNESFSDIFGNAIEFWARPGNASWRIGDDIGAFRSMSDPNQFQNPDTYLGSFWVTGSFDNGGVHFNSGVQNYWFYLLSAGGSGTNDNGDNYAITGIGIENAADIAYRNLSVYLTPNDGYHEARYYAIQSAIDLFGECSTEMITTMNAWHAVGVGYPYTGVLEAKFYTSDTNICRLPANVQFSNQSTSALNYVWYFGDGDSSTVENPSHSYAAPGTYDVTLVAYGCNGSADTLYFPARVIVDLNQPCNINMPANSDPTIETACEGTLYDSGGSNDYLPNSSAIVIFRPGNGQQVQLSFSSFNYAAGDRVTIYDGDSLNDPVIGIYAGTNLPPVATSTNGALLVKESTNGANERSGFVATWSCFVSATDPQTVSDLKLIPNPARMQVRLRMDWGGMAPTSLVIFNAQGQMINSKSFGELSSIDETLDISKLASGVYFLELRAGSLRKAQRLIVQ